MSAPLAIALSGTSGKMGQTLVAAIHHNHHTKLSSAWDAPDSTLLNADAGLRLGILTGVIVRAQPEANARVLIDFTRPQACLDYLDFCVAHRINMVIGTTGFDLAGRTKIATAAQSIAIVHAPNMSIGVNTTLQLLKQAAHYFDTGYDTEIIEAHHRHKVDAPSGTALKMGEVIAQARGQALDQLAVYTREGHTGARKAGSIGFATVRGGDIVGDHTVLFAGDGERIEISHKSSSRNSYAQGAVRAAQFLSDKSQGLFDMNHVLGFSA